VVVVVTVVKLLVNEWGKGEGEKPWHSIQLTFGNPTHPSHVYPQSSSVVVGLAVGIHAPLLKSLVVAAIASQVLASAYRVL
jgi:hypothetical protein